jgi:hypothetical protein
MEECIEIMGELSFEATSDFDLQIVNQDKVSEGRWVQSAVS